MKIKQRLAVVLACLMSVASTEAIVAEAEVNVGNDNAEAPATLYMENMTQEEIDSTIGQFVGSMVYSNKIDQYITLTTSVMNDMQAWLDTKPFNNVSISDIRNDCINVSNSSDQDFVVISNVKLLSSAGPKAYAFEFHFDAYNQVYGFNCWQY